MTGSCCVAELIGGTLKPSMAKALASRMAMSPRCTATISCLQLKWCISAAPRSEAWYV